jgi:hypothetical protein
VKYQEGNVDGGELEFGIIGPVIEFVLAIVSTHPIYRISVQARAIYQNLIEASILKKRLPWDGLASVPSSPSLR